MLLSSTMILETLLMVSLKLTWMSQEVRVFLPFTLGLPGLSGWERAEAALESAATSTRKETKPDISCNILPNKFLKINMFCIRVTSCYSLVNEYGKYYYVHYHFSRQEFKAYSSLVLGLSKNQLTHHFALKSEPQGRSSVSQETPKYILCINNRSIKYKLISYNCHCQHQRFLNRTIFYNFVCPHKVFLYRPISLVTASP